MTIRIGLFGLVTAQGSHIYHPEIKLRRVRQLIAPVTKISETFVTPIQKGRPPLGDAPYPQPNANAVSTSSISPETSRLRGWGLE